MSLLGELPEVKQLQPEENTKYELVINIFEKCDYHQEIFLFQDISEKIKFDSIVINFSCEPMLHIQGSSKEKLSLVGETDFAGWEIKHFNVLDLSKVKCNFIICYHDVYNNVKLNYTKFYAIKKIKKIQTSPTVSVSTTFSVFEETREVVKKYLENTLFQSLDPKSIKIYFVSELEKTLLEVKKGEIDPNDLLKKLCKLKSFGNENGITISHVDDNNELYEINKLIGDFLKDKCSERNLDYELHDLPDY